MTKFVLLLSNSTFKFPRWKHNDVETRFLLCCVASRPCTWRRVYQTVSSVVQYMTLSFFYFCTDRGTDFHRMYLYALGLCDVSRSDHKCSHSDSATLKQIRLIPWWSSRKVGKARNLLTRQKDLPVGGQLSPTRRSPLM